jgi:putative two-component system protein, hydrogenase maturation factor HypX/HoxX
MRILLLTHSFNSLAQRLHVELIARGHDVSVELDVHDAVTREAVELFHPDVVVAPFLKRAIPEDVWRAYRCLVVHPGIVGDRGPSALDWAVLEEEVEWGVTVLEAEAELDAGPVWASEVFPMRPATKSSLYRREVADAAVRAVLTALERIESGAFRPLRLRSANGDATRAQESTLDDATVRGRARPVCRESHRAIDWASDSTERVLRKIWSADGTPGVRDILFDRVVRLYDAHRAEGLRGHDLRGQSPDDAPGAVIARCDGALARATIDGAIWIGHVREERAQALKLTATDVFAAESAALPWATGYSPIRYEEHGPVGLLHFAFYNGAMGTRHCQALRRAYASALERPIRVLVLMGGPDYWSNGIHLALIEAAESPAEESWSNINAIDDLARDIITTTDRLVISAVRGSAGAGGVFLALAADEVWVYQNVVLNPHYKDMGNLHGSEYWSYLLPRRAGAENARRIMQMRLPMGAAEAHRLRLANRILSPTARDPVGHDRTILDAALALATDPALDARLDEKRRRREADENEKPLEAYRAEELERMHQNFYGFDPSYHVARYNFIHGIPKSRTPLTLARHRGRAVSGR